MLALSPTMTDGTIAAWKVKEGDAIKRGTVLCEVETDKAVMDYESSAVGTLLKIVVSAGGSASVGQLIAVVGSPGEDISSVLATTGMAAPAAPAAPAPAAVAPASAPVPTAASVPASPAPAAPARPVASTETGAAFPILPPIKPRSSPLARVLARESAVDLRSVTPSGPGGRVVKRDVEAYLAGERAEVRGGAVPVSSANSNSAPAASSRPPRPVLEDRVVPLTRLRATSAKRVGDSKREAPHFYLRAAVEADRLLALRSSLNAGRDEQEKLSLNAWFVKLSAAAVSLNPAINALWRGEAIEYRRSVDVALAVALADGLVAPVVRDCVHKSVAEIEAEFRVLIAKAKSGKLKPEDYSDATFTISNLGAWGVEEFTAIINPPASAILALGAVAKEAVVRADGAGNDEVVIRSMLRATLSCDHRTIDGAVGAAFLRDLKALFEEPGRALL